MRNTNININIWNEGEQGSKRGALSSNNLRGGVNTMDYYFLFSEEINESLISYLIVCVDSFCV